jgi:hypothetical protein
VIFDINGGNGSISNAYGRVINGHLIVSGWYVIEIS